MVVAWLGVSEVEGLQEAVLRRSQEEACLMEETETPVTIPQDWEQTEEGLHLQTADKSGFCAARNCSVPEP